MKIAVIGAGITGLGAAWALSQRHDVVLLEKADRLGGHSRTIDLELGGKLEPVDTGFIVYNERNYPNLTKLFETLDVPTEPSDMSFSVTSGGFEFAASAKAILSSPATALAPRTASIVRGILRFRSAVNSPELARMDGRTLAEYLADEKYPEAFGRDYLLPLAAAVWSGSGTDAGSMPLATFLEFVGNHGLFDIDRPAWRTVSGGSREYVERIVKELPRVHTGATVRRIDRTGTGVVLDVDGELAEYDHVVFATHPPTTLDLLGSTATDDERRVLEAFRYAPNRAVVHRDASAMPARRSVWSSWNARAVAADDASPVSVTYWMNRLQNLDPGNDVFVTLNPVDELRDVVDDVWFAHPQFDLGTQAAQRELGDIQGRDRIWFAGAWAGYGFHEDGLQAGLTVAAALGSPAPWHDAVVPASSAARHATPRLAMAVV